MKQILLICMTILIALSLAACNRKVEKNNASEDIISSKHENAAEKQDSQAFTESKGTRIPDDEMLPENHQLSH